MNHIDMPRYRRDGYIVIREAIPMIKAHYYPYYSDAHQARVREWGSAGGHARAKNLRKRGGESGKSD